MNITDIDISYIQLNTKLIRNGKPSNIKIIELIQKKYIIKYTST